MIDAFHCFTAKAAKDAAKFVPRLGVHLLDDFEDALTDVKKPLTVCAPTDTDGDGFHDAITDLERYQIQLAKNAPKHVPRLGLRIGNQLGTISLDTIKVDSLMLPTALDAVTSPAPPDLQQHQLDHYECYGVQITKGTPSFPKGLEIGTGADWFTAAARRYLVQKPKRLCLPVEHDGEVRRHPDHLLCYQVKPAKGRCSDAAALNPGGSCKSEENCGGTPGVTLLCVKQTKFVPVSGVRAANQFGAEQLDVRGENELCLPSLRLP